MSSYSDKLKDPRWQRKRLEVMQRDDFTCFDTGAKDEPLNVHHCHYSKGGPWETPTDLLMTLTEDAHKKRQRLEHRGEKEPDDPTEIDLFGQPVKELPGPDEQLDELAAAFFIEKSELLKMATKKAGLNPDDKYAIIEWARGQLS
jgi:hypothetical protein